MVALPHTLLLLLLAGAQTASAPAPSADALRSFVDKPPPDALYRKPAQPIAARAHDLLSRMTLKEKTAQLLRPWETKAPDEVFAQFNETGLGAWYLTMTTLPPHSLEAQQTAVAAAPPTPPTSAGAATVRARNQMQRLFVEKTRLGIPVTFIMETLHSGGPDATIFPMPVNFAASWNATAMELAARVIAAEARAVGTDRGFSPVVNMFPDARYGRVQEGYSEDPWVTKVMGAAHLAGLQGGAMGGPDTYLSNFTHALIGTVKHYAAYGMSSGGIDGSPADLSEQKLREMYLAPFEYLADGRGLRSVMAAQNMVNGRPMHSNKRLLTDVLRGEWNVTDALVESDGGDCIGALQGFHVGATREDVVVRSIESGMDMDLGGSAFSFDVLGNAVLNNKTTMAAVDKAVYRVLVSKFAAGIFDHPYTDESRVKSLDRPENRQLAREIAEESFVLAINENGTLPIKAIATKNIALVGWLADSVFDHCGSYFNAGANVVTVKAAMEAAGLSMTYSVGATPDDGPNSTAVEEAVAAAHDADVVVAVLGDSKQTCGEMVDRSDLDLPGGQLPLLQALTATGKPVVVLLIHGRQVTFGRNNVGLDGVSALMIGWRPGEEGGPAFLNVLSGQTSPSGRLAQAWPRSVGGIGGPGAPYLYPFQGNHMGEAYSAGDGPSSPLFQFGHVRAKQPSATTVYSYREPPACAMSIWYTIPALLAWRWPKLSQPAGLVLRVCAHRASRIVRVG